MANLNEETRKKYADALREMGFPWQAKYIEKFGDDLDPGYSWRKPNKQSEAFYKICVEEGHPWDWYHEYPEDTVF